MSKPILYGIQHPRPAKRTLPKKILMHLHHHRADVDVCGILVIALQL